MNKIIKTISIGVAVALIVACVPKKMTKEELSIERKIMQNDIDGFEREFKSYKVDSDSINKLLHTAVLYDADVIVDKLLDAGANPNTHDFTRNKNPILYYPVIRDNLKVAQLLVRYGANTDFFWNIQAHGVSKHITEFAKSEEMKKILTVDANRQEAMLIKAVKSGDEKRFLSEYKKKRTLSVKDKDGLNAVQLAAELGYDHLIVIMAKIDPGFVSKHATDVLVRRLRFEEWEDRFPAHEATLINIRKTDRPMFLAIKNEEHNISDIEFASLVTSRIKPVDASILPTWTKAPIYDRAQSHVYKMNKHISFQVKKAGLAKTEANYRVVLEKTIRLLVNLGANINVNMGSGITPYHSFAAQGPEWRVRLIHELGGNINAKDIKGKTPLHYAFPVSSFSLTDDNKIIIETMVGLGANKNARDRNGLTPQQSYLKKAKEYLAEYTRVQEEYRHELEMARLKKEQERKLEEERKRIAAAKAAQDTEETWRNITWFANEVANNLEQQAIARKQSKAKFNNMISRINQDYDRKRQQVMTSYTRNQSVTRSKIRKQQSRATSSVNNFMNSLSSSTGRTSIGSSSDSQRLKCAGISDRFVWCAGHCATESNYDACTSSCYNGAYMSWATSQGCSPGIYTPSNTQGGAVAE